MCYGGKCDGVGGTQVGIVYGIIVTTAGGIEVGTSVAGIITFEVLGK
jgi:hypothetical protein